MASELVESLKAVAGVAAPVGVLLGVMLAGWRATLAATLFPQLTKNQAERIILHLAYLAWSAALASMATYAYVAQLKEPPGRIASTEAPSKAASPPDRVPDGRSGWILVGRFHRNGAPTADVVARVIRPSGAAVGALAEYTDGAAIEVAYPTAVRVINFVNAGWANASVSPLTKIKGLEPGDETGVVLRAGTFVIARQVETYRSGELVVVWMRVGARSTIVPAAAADSAPPRADVADIWILVSVLAALLCALVAFVIGRGLRQR